jgi:PKD repeat protein
MGEGYSFTHLHKETAGMNKSRFTYLSFILSLLMIATFLVWSTQPTEADTIGAVQASSLNHSGADSFIYLPLITDITPFEPPADTTLPGGVYTFSSFNIPADVTVTVTGDVHITVTGDTSIAGTLAGDCVEVTINGQQDVSLTGMADNECSDEDADGKDLVIHSNRGDMTVGTPDEPAVVRSSGNLDIGNDPNAEEWEFDVLPHQRATDPLAPTCSARADTLIGLTTPDFPAEVAFWGEGADPNGGPVSYEWDFGDGASSIARDPVHNYSAAGTYDVSLTVTDTDGQTCESRLHLVITDDVIVPAVPAVWISQPQTVLAAQQPFTFTAAADHATPQSLLFAWDFGDGTQMTGETPTHTYSAPGRYEVTLTIEADDGSMAVATTAVYAYDPSQQLPDSLAHTVTAASPCQLGGPNVYNLVFNGGKARNNSPGRDLIVRGWGNIYLGPGTNLKAQDGGNGSDRMGSGTIRARNGRVGGRLIVFINGPLTVCGGAILAGGDGGHGGDATSITPAPGHARAFGGRGSDPSRLLMLASTRSISFESPTGLPIIMRPGDAGNGGWATAVGEDGNPGCNTAHPGALATARGGQGGDASKYFFSRGAVFGLGLIEVQTGGGGDGGNAEALAGNGGDATCVTTATGGNGRDAVATGGKGGPARLLNVPPGMTVNGFAAGDGGMALARGGDGGAAVATPPGGTVATGGDAGNATASGGNGGIGRSNGNGGDSTADAGWGGMANAIGEDGADCADGLDATATGGQAGNATANKGTGAVDGLANAFGGNGGHAVATGGQGGDCPVCGGDGGNGGAATATGTNGGTASGDGNTIAGDGGDGDALGGQGGDGGDCDCNKLNPQAGGNGGDGGDADSTAGQPGGPGGQPGDNALRGGHGGDGGDGDPPGDGGDGGIGTGTPVDIPDGDPGQDGNPCPPLRFWFIYHSTIPNGLILPGTEFDLGTYDDPDPSTDPTGVVNTRFMDADDLADWNISPDDIFYDKLDGDLFIGQGGIRYNLHEIADDFPVIGLEFTVWTEMPESVLLVGYYQDEMIGMTTNQGGEPGEPDVVLLPDPGEFGSSAPYYNRLEIIILGPISFYHWWVVIIDP